MPDETDRSRRPRGFGRDGSVLWLVSSDGRYSTVRAIASLRTSVHLIADGPQNRLHKGVNLYLESCKWVQPFPRARVRLAPQSDDTARGHAGQRKRYAEHLSVHISA